MKLQKRKIIGYHILTPQGAQMLTAYFIDKNEMDKLVATYPDMVFSPIFARPRKAATKEKG